MVTSDAYRELGEAAWSWVLSYLQDDDGPWFPESVAADWQQLGPPEYRDSFYSGIGGLAPVFAEIVRYRTLSEGERALATRVETRLRAGISARTEPSLYDGLAGDATALRMLGHGGESIALGRLAELMTPAGWRSTEEFPDEPEPYVSDLVMGTAGVVLTAIWAGGEHCESIALTGCESLLRVADRTDAGLDWAMLPGQTSRGPNYAHGTAGIATALVVAGAALDRRDFVDAAIEGARHLLSVGTLDDDGFIVPHTIPPSARVVEPVTYTWCHGPAGTSHLFAALSRAGVAEVAGHQVSWLRDQCLDSILGSGIPQRLRPGFWDNDGRCCGTAGVGDVLLDAFQDCQDPARADTLIKAARAMGDALVERVIRDDSGARWRFVEYRQEPPLLPPGTLWMQGAAGIAAFLLRLTRVLQNGPSAPVVDRPDQWWAVPADLLTVHGHRTDPFAEACL